MLNADGSRTGDQRETLETRIVRDTNSEDILKTMDGSRDEAWRRYKSPGPDGILPALLQKGLLPSIVL
jgi:hypothetical protein